MRSAPSLALVVLVSFLPINAADATQSENPHVNFIRSLNTESFTRGKKLYQSICITCHGTPQKEGTLPTSRPFWKETFKNGGDPYSLFKTLTMGLGQMPS